MRLIVSDFDFKGNKYGIKGPFLMTNTNLKVELLDDKTRKEKIPELSHQLVYKK